MLIQNKPFFFNACKQNKKRLALTFMRKYRNKCNPSYVDELGNTALLWACKNKMTDVALKIIRYYDLECKPSNENRYKSNALRYACKYNLKEVAFLLISEFGEACNPECMGTDRTPSFMWACKNKMGELSSHMILIYGNRCIPGYISSNNNTALIWACKNKLENTAMLLLDVCSDSCNINHKDNHNKTAFNYVNNNNRLLDLALRLINLSAESNHRQLIQLRHQISEFYEDEEDEELTIESLNNLFELDNEDYDNENIRPSITNDTDTNTDINTNNNNTRECSVCFGKLIREVLLRPCNHICMCETCTARIQNGNNLCPICRTPIFSIEQVYLV